MAGHAHAHQHGHGDHVRLDEADWARMAEHTEREGELLLSFVSDAAGWIADARGADAPPVRRILDIGSGPGVGTCELAARFPDAHVVAVDGSPAMLERAARRAAARRLSERVSTLVAELPEGLDDVEPAEVIWASLSLHHIGDEVGALRLLRERLVPGGLLAIAEIADPMRVLPDELGFGRPGLVGRAADAAAGWFRAMRDGLDGSVPSAPLASMVETAGFDVLVDRVARVRIDAPLSRDARLVVRRSVEGLRKQFGDRLDADDLDTLTVLADLDDPRGVMHRPDVFVEASRQIVIARAGQTTSSGDAAARRR